MADEIKSLPLSRDTLANKRNLSTACGIVLVAASLGMKFSNFPFLGGEVTTRAPVWAVHVVAMMVVCYFAAAYYWTYRRDTADWRATNKLNDDFLGPLKTWLALGLANRVPEFSRIDDTTIIELHRSPNARSELDRLGIGGDNYWTTNINPRLHLKPALEESHRLETLHATLRDTHRRHSRRVNEMLPMALLVAAILASVWRIGVVVWGWPDLWPSGKGCA